MAQQKIFIAHTSVNEDYAREICNSLSRIVEFSPYLAQDYPSFGDSFKDRIQNAIENCKFFIVCFSASALPNQWVNQELGYACAVKRRKPDAFHIIPISQSNLDIKGMITRDSEDILFEDKFTPENLIASIILAIRLKIYKGLDYGTLHYKVTCRHCTDHKNLPTIYHVSLPEHRDILRTIETGETSWHSLCISCKQSNYSNILTWEPANGKTRQPQ